MRNFVKPAGSPARHRARGLAAVVASVALAAGLGAYPAVQAEETTAVSDITTDDAGLPTYSWMDDDTPSSSATPSAPAAASASNPASASASKPAEAPATANPVTVERKGDIDRIVVNDPEGEAWEFGGKASKENIFALQREGKGEIKEVLSVTADGRKLEPYDYGFVNTADSGFVAFNLNALHTIPPVDVEIEIRTTDAGEYAIAESTEVPSEAELAESGYGKGRPAEEQRSDEERAAAPGGIPGVPGQQDQEFSLTDAKPDFLGDNPQIEFKINETGNWRVTRFAIKKNKNDNNTKGISGPVRIRVVRQGAVVVDRTLDFPNAKYWQTNAKGKSFDTEFQLIPSITDLYIKGGDSVILNPVAPPNGIYRVQMWGQDMDNKPQDHKVNVAGDGIPVSSHTTIGDNPYETTFDVQARSNFSSATVTLSPSVRLEDVFFSIPIEQTDGIRLENKVETYSDRVVITWFPTKDGHRIDSVPVSADSTVTLRTSYRSAPTRPEDITLQGSLAAPVEKDLPILPSADADVLPLTHGDKCELRDVKSVHRQPPRLLSIAEQKYGFRRFIVASPQASSNRTSSQLYLQVEDGQGALQSEKIGPASGWVYNALAYNENDNYLYAVSQPRISVKTGHKDDPCFPAGHLLQINPYTGEVFDLGKLQGLDGFLPENHPDNTTSNDLGSGINAGTFDDDGTYWVAGASVWGSGRLYSVNLDTITATLKPAKNVTLQAKTIWNPGQTFRTVSEDFVAIPGAKGYLWGLQSGWAQSDGRNKQRVFLERISTSGGAPLRVDITDMKMPDGQTVGQLLNITDQAPVWGQAWVEEDGSIAFGKGGRSSVDSNTTEVIKIKVGNPTAKAPNLLKVEVVGAQTAPSSYNTDGASAKAPTTTPEPIVPDVTKEAIGQSAKKQEDGTYIVKYQVNVTNPGNREAAYSKVVDTPTMPTGIVVKKTSWSLVDEFGKSYATTFQTGQGPFVLSGGGTIQPKGLNRFGATSNGIHQFNVEMTISLDAYTGNETGDECAPGKSLFNSVQVGPKEAKACVPPPEVEKKARLVIAKISSDAVSHELLKPENRLDGAEFILQKLDENGQVIGNGIPMIYDKENRIFKSEELEPGHYQLVETRSPQDSLGVYNLLVKPIVFSLSVDNGNVTIALDEDAKIVATQVDKAVAPSSWQLTSQDAVLTVANVRQGNLPKTGGSGLQLPILLGGALIAAGALVGRRRVVA
ncbi:DUF6923 family protein [Corynebacterium pseudogenitalium]|uniref:DUF6923 family protein n=1 Tax=Corynebacterium pseudogenitalium TaxID=38303 RepID=UPI003B9F4541